jgi:DNA-binding NarL/FixJ family response regulator
MKRLLIVDDHDGFRRVARAMLEPAGYEVVGEAADGESALHLAKDLDPDLVLLDIVLPDVDGFEVCRRLRERENGPIVILTSSRDPDLYRYRMAATPAAGFIAKSDLSPDAVEALLDQGAS